MCLFTLSRYNAAVAFFLSCIWDALHVLCVGEVCMCSAHAMLCTCAAQQELAFAAGSCLSQVCAPAHELDVARLTLCSCEKGIGMVSRPTKALPTEAVG